MKLDRDRNGNHKYNISCLRKMTGLSLTLFAFLLLVFSPLIGRLDSKPQLGRFVSISRLTLPHRQKKFRSQLRDVCNIERRARRGRGWTTNGCVFNKSICITYKLGHEQEETLKGVTAGLLSLYPSSVLSLLSSC